METEVRSVDVGGIDVGIDIVGGIDADVNTDDGIVGRPCVGLTEGWLKNRTGGFVVGV